MALKLRDYQQEAVDATFDAWSNRGLTRVAMEIATGGGKTLVFAEILKQTIAAKPDAKIVVLAHRGELLRAAQKTISKHCGIQVGVVDGTVAPSLRKRHLECQVVCINTATLGVSKNARTNASKRVVAVTELHRILGFVDLVVLDECHRANTDTTNDCLTELGCYNNTRLLGVTATLFRSDKKMLTDIFEECVYKKSLIDLIEEGHLVDINIKQAFISGLDLTKVATSRSMSITDFNATDLDRVMEKCGAEGVIAEFAKRYTGARKTLIFTPTVASAERVAASFTKLGMLTKVVHGSMKPQERAAVLDDFENGTLQFAVNCMILTEGVDLPSCSCIIMARPTKSKQLYLQILGRSLRLADEKDDALIIDLVGAASVNGLINAENIFDTQGNESALQAAQRSQQVQQLIQTKAAQVHAALSPEDQEEFNLESILSGSFNLFDVDVPELIAAVKKQAQENRQTKERQRFKSLPVFEGPGRCGALLELDFDFLCSLSSWATLPQYKNSYAAGLVYDDKFWAFYCDSSKRFDTGRYGFICEGVASFEEMERAIIEFSETFPATAGALYFKQNKLQPHSELRRRKPSADQLKFMLSMLARLGIRKDEVAKLKNKELRHPDLGSTLDQIDFCLLQGDARKQISAVKEFLKNE